MFSLFSSQPALCSSCVFEEAKHKSSFCLVLFRFNVRWWFTLLCHHRGGRSFHSEAFVLFTLVKRL